MSATLNCPLGLDMDSQGNLYVADTDNNVIRKIDTGTPRIITTIAGNGTAGHSGDGGLATNATLNSPDRVSVNGAREFFSLGLGKQHDPARGRSQQDHYGVCRKWDVCICGGWRTGTVGEFRYPRGSCGRRTRQHVCGRCE